MVRVTYIDKNISQLKSFIQQSEYSDIIVPVKKRIVELETQIETKSVELTKGQRTKLSPEDVNVRRMQLGAAKALLEPYSGQYFTSESPMGIAFLDKSGIMHLSENQGGDHKISFEIIEE